MSKVRGNVPQPASPFLGCTLIIPAEKIISAFKHRYDFFLLCSPEAWSGTEIAVPKSRNGKDRNGVWSSSTGPWESPSGSQSRGGLLQSPLKVHRDYRRTQ
ncbi:Protein of unknown function [Pyronema omphalodes CBS 100304]|uniref:Uncharacterized protein n=1 Tax=Pyronema omphalodes (strain CBS 100304) TaxID=1076935 RepID=U4L810_PYROM|nr:Protein of unknown function [Pyronema omphalodes CBS 100304]